MGTPPLRSISSGRIRCGNGLPHVVILRTASLQRRPPDLFNVTWKSGGAAGRIFAQPRPSLAAHRAPPRRPA